MSMSLTDRQLSAVDELLRDWTNHPITIREIVPLDHSVYGQTMSRLFLDQSIAEFESTLILKRRREAGSFRSEPRAIQTEIAVLDLLMRQPRHFGPRLIGGDGETGVVVLEDLGAGPSLEHVLFSNDFEHAQKLLNLFAATLAELHIAMAGQEAAFDQACRAAGMTEAEVAEMPGWYQDAPNHLRELAEGVAGQADLPQPGPEVMEDLLTCRDAIADAGPYRTLVHADPCPANTRVVEGQIVMLDFESSLYDHALHNVLNLIRMSSCPCWSVLPESVANKALAAYRQTFAAHHPGVLDDDEFFRQLAMIALLEAIGRIRAWKRLDQADEPHPVGFTKRAQRLETVRAAVELAKRAEVAPALTAWLGAFQEALRERWHDTPMTLTGFPAFASIQPDLKVGLPLEGIAT